MSRYRIVMSALGFTAFSLSAFLKAVAQQMRPQYFSAGPTHWIITMDCRLQIADC